MNIKVVSFNIKCDDTIADIKPEFQWQARKQNLIEQIQKFDADIIDMQEVMPHQYDFFNQNLKQEYYSIFQSRDNNASNGEGCPIFFKTDKFDLIEQKTFWLSETPEIHASSSWNSRWPRICTYAILQEKQTGKKIAIFNTHLDHKSEDARVNGIKLIISKIKSFDLPTILTGDFNCAPNTEVVKLCKNEFVYANTKNDNSITFHLWGHPEILQEGIRYIDYIFVKGFGVDDYKVMNDVKNATQISDHYALQVQLKFE